MLSDPPGESGEAITGAGVGRMAREAVLGVE